MWGNRGKHLLNWMVVSYELRADTQSENLRLIRQNSLCLSEYTLLYDKVFSPAHHLRGLRLYQANKNWLSREITTPHRYAKPEDALQLSLIN